MQSNSNLKVQNLINSMKSLLKQIMLMIFVAMVFVPLTGCNSMCSITPSSTPITSRDSYTKLGETQGNSFGIILLWFFPICEPNPSQIARDAAIRRGGGNALIEVVEQTCTFTLLAVTFRWITVEGTAVQVKYRGKEIE